MPLPLAPVAGIALRYGAVALIAYSAARRIEKAPRDIRAEEAMDDVNEGMAMRRDNGQGNATARWRRIVRLGRNGPGLEIDVTNLTRVRYRKV